MKNGFLLCLVLAFLPPPPALSGEQGEWSGSPVEYEEGLTGPFFEGETWRAPWWIIEHDDGTFEDTTGRITRREDIPRLRNTADCRTGHQLPHTIRFSSARRIDEETVEIRIRDETASTYDDVMILVRNGRFLARYRTVYPVAAANDGIVWTTKKQRLVLNKRSYRDGETIRGWIEFECTEESTDPRSGAKERRVIRIEGPFKPVLEAGEAASGAE